MLCLGIKLLTRRSQCLCALAGGKQLAPWIKIEIIVSDAGPVSKIVLLCFNYRNYLADVCQSAGRMLTYCSGGGQKVTVPFESVFF